MGGGGRDTTQDESLLLKLFFLIIILVGIIYNLSFQSEDQKKTGQAVNIYTGSAF